MAGMSSLVCLREPHACIVLNSLLIRSFPPQLKCSDHGVVPGCRGLVFLYFARSGTVRYFLCLTYRAPKHRTRTTSTIPGSSTASRVYPVIERAQLSAAADSQISLVGRASLRSSVNSPSVSSEGAAWCLGHSLLR